jgi:hypothetical protein
MSPHGYIQEGNRKEKSPNRAIVNMATKESETKAIQKEKKRHAVTKKTLNSALEKRWVIRRTESQHDA